ncbi:NADPH:quinone reductase [Microtetraspora sp. NBRC 16547]|uniref:NADPH:quinone reductase n=1 Tax=Microtetraspora sp. NBRC 16547 TaxID=3030993 RepID=UPI0024A463F2|nr:NADPH:quinone reductase [Microtetraspora sp. NBRC 16547]GLW99999.1 oxidoreductase [Microtetraspora sp. NBRC 16547]
MGTRQMRAAYVTELGPAERIHVGELPVPQPGPTDVLIQVETVAANHVDTFIRSGLYHTPTPFPFVIGRDLVGTITETGPGVTAFAPGDRAWCNSLGHGGRQGSFSQYAVTPADRLYPLPPGIDPVTAVAALHPAATAYLGLFREARIHPGETVVIGGGAGAVGSCAITMAAAAGARVIATARPDDEERCHELGATEVIDYRTPHLLTRLGKAAPDGIDLYWDTSGHHDIPGVTPLLAHGGRILLTAGISARTELPVGSLYTRDARLLGFAISNATTADLAAAAALVNRLLAAGRLRVRLGEVLPLDQAAEAHRMLEDGQTSGRIVLRP